MRLKKLLILLLGVWLIGCDVNFSTEPTKSIGLENANQDDITNALTASNRFLKKLDAGKFKSSWDNLSLIIKNDISESKWNTTINTIRRTTGSLVRRLEPKAGFTETLPDTQPGKYFIFDYPSEFKNIEAKERIVVGYEGGNWKIVGYFLTKSIVKVTEK